MKPVCLSGAIGFALCSPTEMHCVSTPCLKCLNDHLGTMEMILLQGAQGSLPEFLAPSLKDNCQDSMEGRGSPLIRNNLIYDVAMPQFQVEQQKL